MNFKPGQKVVCINDTVTHPGVLRDFNNWIKKGTIYTVREYKFMSLLSEYALYLEEISNTPIYIDILGCKVEPAYRATRFKPLEECLDENLELIEEELSL